MLLLFLQEKENERKENMGVCMREEFIRSALLLGEDAIANLSTKKVAVFGIGGVGGYVVEALARSGVGHFVLVDDDVVSISNINRQIIAMHSTIGMPKVEAMKARILDINPRCHVEAIREVYMPDNKDRFAFSTYDYVVDAIDTVTGKISLVEECTKLGVPILSAMGAGNKLDPTRFEVADISKTSVCPLARVMRRELRARGIERLKVVYSKEESISPKSIEEICVQDRDERFTPTHTKRQTPGSLSFVPPVMGLIIAKEVVLDLIWKEKC